MIAIVTENYGGKWPFWLSPRQVMVVPVGPMFDDYAEKVKQLLYVEGFMCEVDTDAGDTMNKKIRNAQLAQFNFILGAVFEWNSFHSNSKLRVSVRSGWGERED